jgi:hypothetical protein
LRHDIQTDDLDRAANGALVHADRRGSVASRDVNEVKRPTAAVLVGLLLTVAGFLVALLVLVIALMVAAQILPDHNAPMTP